MRDLGFRARGRNPKGCTGPQSLGEWTLFVFGHVGLSFLGYHLWGFSRGGGAFPKGPGAYVLLAFFSLLPDIVDKPLALWVVPELDTTRWMGHTLAFSALVCAIVWRFLPDLLIFSLACPGHLLLDSMWRSPHTLLFPLLGFKWDPGTDPNISLWELLGGNLRRIFSEPHLALPEIIGLAVILVIGARLSWLALARGRETYIGPRG